MMKISAGSPRILLIHSSRDKDLAREFGRLLELDGFSPLFDEKLIRPSQRLEIRTVIQSADAAVLFLTDNAIDDESLLSKTIRSAIDIASHQTEDRLFLAPLRFQRCNVPENLRALRWLEVAVGTFSIGNAYSELQRSLLRWMERVDPEALEERKRLQDLSSMKFPTSFNYFFPKGYSFTSNRAYLVRGRCSDGTMYYSIAKMAPGLAIRPSPPWTVAELIAGKSIRVQQPAKEGVFSLLGNARSVPYRLASADGVLVGHWGEGGLEEMIPVSPLATVA